MTGTYGSRASEWQPVRVIYRGGDVAYLTITHAACLIASDDGSDRDAVKARLIAGETITRQTGTKYRLAWPG